MLMNTEGPSSAVVVCEHASNFIPTEYGNLGLDKHAATSHAAWDPGALGVTRRLAKALDAVAVTGTISRLVCDLNRPPSAHDASTQKSELIKVPGNVGLSDEERAERAAKVYEPFRRTLAAQISNTSHPVLITVHSFTPIYHGKQRDVEIGILHDADARLADAMIDIATQHTSMNVQRNEPYGPENGVMHTLREHAVASGHLNVMLEIRNDLIAQENQQIHVAKFIATWISEAFNTMGVEGDVQCKI